MSTVNAEDSKRFIRIQRTWRQALGSWGRFSFERIQASFGIAVSFGFLFVFLITPFDAILWSVQSGAFRLQLPIQLTWFVVAIALTLNGLLNATLLHRIYLQKNLQEYRVHPGITILRGLLGAFPVFGFLTFFLWRRLLKNRPQWILRQDRNRPPLSLATPASQTWMKRLSGHHVLSSKSLLLGTFIINVLGWAVLNQWISGFSTTSRVWPFLAGSLALHLIAFFFMMGFLEVRVMPGPDAKIKNLITSLFWLLPVPYLPLAGILFLSWVTAETQRSRTLTNFTFSRQGVADKLSFWGERLNLAGKSRLGIGPLHTLNSSQARSRILALCDVKSFAVTIDIAAVSWYLEFSTRASPVASFFTRGLLGLAMLGAFALAFASLASWMLTLVQRWSGKPPSSWRRKTLARSLGLLSIFLFLGIIEGVLWHRRPLPYSTHPLLWVVALYISNKGLTLTRFFIPHGEKPTEGGADHLLRLLCLIGVWFGQIVLSVSTQVGRVDITLIAWSVYFALCELLPGLIRLPWLLRPYQIRDLASPVLPLSRKTAIAFLAFTALAPGGGLAAPIWILWRHRLELETARTAPLVP